MEVIVLTIKIIITFFYFISFILIKGEIINPAEILKLNSKTRNIYINLEKFIDKLRFCRRWTMFLGDQKDFDDIKIIAKSHNKEKIWYLIRDKEIGTLKIYSQKFRLNLVLNYDIIGKYFLNEEIVNNLKSFFKNYKEDLLEVRIQRVTFDSSEKDQTIFYRLKTKKIEDIFYWKK